VDYVEVVVVPNALSWSEVRLLEVEAGPTSINLKFSFT